ncbi:hypothetical protein KRX54_00380 [Actinomycetaceae bacterium TAE3-ERU4]|nr:hypothetical protein [Actinomycetaceae bacterium TAE3-ERU4]
MGVVDAPQWLISAFVRSAQTLGATSEKEYLVERCHELIERWSSEDRVFHNQRHLINTLAALDEIISASHNPEILRMAAWYHGAVFTTEAPEAYSREAGEVMAPSAEYALKDLTEMGIPEKTSNRIAELILSLGKHHSPEGDLDASVLIDAELSMLAASPQDYKKYCDGIAAEYAHIPRARFLKARAAIIEHLLARRPLFTSPLGAQWEKPAKQNLEAEQAKLLARIDDLTEEELSALGDCPPCFPNNCDSADSSEKSTGSLEETPVIPVAVHDPLEGNENREPTATFSSNHASSEATLEDCATHSTLSTLETVPEPPRAQSEQEQPNFAELSTGNSETSARAHDDSPPKRQSIKTFLADKINEEDAEASNYDEDFSDLDRSDSTLESASGAIQDTYSDEEDLEEEFLEEEPESQRSKITSTLEFADDCLDTAEMRALKELKNLAPGIPHMKPPEENK